MLQLFKRNDVVGFAILVVVAFLLSLSYFVQPPNIEVLGNFYKSSIGSFAWMKTVYSHHPRLYVFFSLLCWLAVSIYGKQVVVNLKLVPQRNFVPSIAILLSVFSMPMFFVLSVSGLAAIALFIALGQILATPYNKTARSRYFAIGAFIGIAAILYFPYCGMFLAAFIILLSMRLFVWQEILALFFGALFPIYLIFMLHYILVGEGFAFSLQALSVSLPTTLQMRPASILMLATALAVVVYGILISRKGISGNKVQLTKKWNGLLVYFIFSMLVGLLTAIFPSHALILPALCFSIILSSALINNYQKYNTFTFYLILLVVLSLQWVVRFI